MIDQTEQNKEKLEKARQFYADKVMTVNGHEYEITRLSHSKRMDVFDFMQKSGLDNGFRTPEYKKSEKIVFDMLTYNGLQLSKMNDPWGEDSELIGDFLEVVSVGMLVVIVPLLPAESGG